MLGAARSGAYRLKGGANAKAVRRAGETAKALAYADLRPWLAELRGQGISLRQIAVRLNKEGHMIRRGKLWNPMQVGRVLVEDAFTEDILRE